jgi:hypothetical protein
MLPRGRLPMPFIGSLFDTGSTDIRLRSHLEARPPEGRDHRWLLASGHMAPACWWTATAAEIGTGSSQTARTSMRAVVLAA